MKNTIKTLLVIAGLMQGTAVFAACDQKGYDNCLETRRNCWKDLPKGDDWEERARTQCDEPFKQCAIDRGCMDASMEDIKQTPENTK